MARFREAKTFLSYTDFIRFARLVAECDEKQRTRLLERNQRNVLLLKKQRYGSFSLSHDTIINLSDKELTDIEKMCFPVVLILVFRGDQGKKRSWRSLNVLPEIGAVFSTINGCGGAVSLLTRDNCT